MTDIKTQALAIWSPVRRIIVSADFMRQFAIMTLGMFFMYLGWAPIVLTAAIIWTVVVIWRSADLTLPSIYRQLAIYIPYISFAVIFAVIVQSLHNAAGLSLHLLAQQVLLVLIYLAWLIWRLGWSEGAKSGFVVAGAIQFFGLWAVFLAATAWRSIPTILIIAGAWGTSLVAAQTFFAVRPNRARMVLASVWALIVAELTWLFSFWLVDYTVLGLLLPQPVLVITSLSYCFASIYLAYSESKLSRPRLAEYLFIGLILILLVASGINWNGI
jgi:hypothetical protein